MCTPLAAWFACVLGLALNLGCAGGTPAKKPPPEPPAARAEPAPEKPKPAEPAAESAPSEPAAQEKTSRDVKYIVTGGNLEIEVSGCRFKPKAKAVRVGDGWGIKLTVEAEARDDETHSILYAKNGPLAFAGKIHRKDKVVDIDDKREGGEDAFVSPGAPMKFEREWPGKSGEKPLRNGDKIELQVALWGISENSDPSGRRLVRKFMIVSMSVGKGEPRALIAPPE